MTLTKEEYAYRKANGICVNHVRAEAVPGYAHCAACMERNQELEYLRRVKRALERRCRRCGKKLPNGYQFRGCVACRKLDVRIKREVRRGQPKP